MGDRTQVYEDEGEPSYEWDDTAPRGPRIFWGRVLALAALLLIAFLLGRWTAPEGVSRAQFEAVREERDDLEAEVAELRAGDEGAEQGEGGPAPTPTPGEDETTEDGDEAPPGSKTYVVKRGDTLQTIAQKFYGDRTLDYVIQRANNITQPELLRTGTELTIPPEPD